MTDRWWLKERQRHCDTVCGNHFCICPSPKKGRDAQRELTNTVFFFPFFFCFLFSNTIYFPPFFLPHHNEYIQDHVLTTPEKLNCKSRLTDKNSVSGEHVLSILFGTIRANVRNTHQLPSFFWIPRQHRLCERCREEKVGKEYGWSCRVQDSQEFKHVYITWSQDLVHIHWCFQDESARYVFQRTWKCSWTDTWRSQTKWFCR